MIQIKIPTKWGRYLIAYLFIMVLTGNGYAQQKRPIIQANSTKVDIKDGEIFQKEVWNLSPQIKPDVYYALEPIVEKTITFYTDIDSISFPIVPGKSYDFIVLLNNKDTCYTQIATTKPIKEKEAATFTPKRLETQMLQTDFTVFRQALEKEHPGLYRYKSKKELDRLFDSCFAALDQPMTQLEFGKSILFLISSLQDGHTGTNLLGLLRNYYRENEKLFPLPLYFTQNKAFMVCSKIKELPVESEILTIDHKPIHEIVKELYKYLPSDGKIESRKRQAMSGNAFPILYNLIFGNKSTFLVEYKTKQAEIKTTSIAAQFVKDFVCDEPRKSDNTNKALDLKYPQSNVALLTIKTFDDSRFGGKENFTNFLEKSFKEITTKKVYNLIIDLRGNTGGADDLGALLYSYLTNKPFNYFASKESTTGKVSANENSLLGIQLPQKNNYRGKVSFLIDGVSFSTTADFCAIAKSHNRGKFMGEETGGGYYGNTSGGRKDVSLPNSEIMIIIPTHKYVNAVKKTHFKDRGIIPDYPIIPNVSEIIQNKDVVLDFALKLVKK